MFFEALFFAFLLILMAKSDISFLWPLTGLSFVFATLAAIWFLREQVSGIRWAGVVLIMLGARPDQLQRTREGQTAPRRRQLGIEDCIPVTPSAAQPR